MSTISNAIAQRDNSPVGLIQQYKSDFATMLPSHINADQWSRVAIGALRRDPRLAQAAQNDVGAFLAALSNAARLGLEAGTEQYHLTPRKEKGVEKILGIVGYQGLIELIYRAGAVSSVIAEIVYRNDHFEYAPGRHERPIHEIDWDADDRGDLRLAYAYAIMKDGATSKVVVLNKAQIETIKKSSQGSNTPYSPWVTTPAAMWLKSAVRQLAKWVPTSAEYRKDQIRAVHEVAAEMASKVGNVALHPMPVADGEHVDPVTGEIYADNPDEAVEAELVEPAGWEK